MKSLPIGTKVIATKNARKPYCSFGERGKIYQYYKEYSISWVVIIFDKKSIERAWHRDLDKTQIGYCYCTAIKNFDKEFTVLPGIYQLLEEL
jgi:hypothetical protein